MLKKFNHTLNNVMLCSAAVLASPHTLADPIDEAIAGSKVYGDLRLRFEEVDNGSTTEALTLRTVLGVKTGEVNGFSATVEMEDVRQVMGVDEAGNTIPDPDDANTELDQAFVQYKNANVMAKLGRQVITLDGHRHVGHVGWRQDKQTFDAGRITLNPFEGLTVDLSHIYKVNRINSPAFGDVDTDHTLLNVAYTTPIGKVVGYYYGLSEDGLYDETQTTGLSFGGKVGGEKVKFLYNMEYATQDNKTSGVEPDYLMLEAGLSAVGVTAKIGQETLSSDTKNGVTENFVTPLATVHKFQGWADVFLGGSLTGTIDGGNGVEDLYFSLGSKLAGIKLLAVYHDYESEGGSNDLGEELNLLAVKKFGKRYSVGLKYADYDNGDIGADVEKLWAWVGMKI
jgi:hypothetical protein